MPKTRLNTVFEFPEVIVSDKELSSNIYKAVKQKKLKKLGSRLYTTNLDDAPEIIIKRNLWQIVASFFPRAVIADRTALDSKPTPDGNVFIISDKKNPVHLPGLHILPRKGARAHETDRPFIGGLFLSSPARAFLENMSPSRARTTSVGRTFSRTELEEQLDHLLRVSGVDSVNKLRDEARILAPQLNLEKEYKQFEQLIGALPGTSTDRLYSELGQMRVAGTPYDPKRLPILQTLFESLNSYSPIIRSAMDMSSSVLTNLAFFEAYFSNFIEGTEFAISEAEEIIFQNKIPSARPEDAHDVLGTFQIVADLSEMQKVPQTFDEFLTLLKMRHTRIMIARPAKRPGEFKIEKNRAGNTLFVMPELAVGTLYKGFEFYQALQDPFSKAIYMMFLVAEVHPFDDGNGRLARIMMNAELVARQQMRIIIPTIYRNNYLVALKSLSNNQVADPLIRMLDFAQKYTASIDWHDLQICRKILQRTHAFDDPYEADSVGIRLTLP